MKLFTFTRETLGKEFQWFSFHPVSGINNSLNPIPNGHRIICSGYDMIGVSQSSSESRHGFETMGEAIAWLEEGENV